MPRGSFLRRDHSPVPTASQSEGGLAPPSTRGLACGRSRTRVDVGRAHRDSLSTKTVVAFSIVVGLFSAVVSARQPAPPVRSTVASDGHQLAVWSRVPQAPRAVVLLVHGRTWSSRPDFDLQVPGLERSVMRSLAARGLAVYAVDLRGYGETPRDRTGWLTPNRAAADVVNVLAWVRGRHPNLDPPALVGWSRGAAIAMLAAQTTPSAVSSLVLFGFAYDPALKFADVPAPASGPARLTNTVSAAASDFVSPRVTPPTVVRAFVDQALRTDPILADLKDDHDFNALAPARVTMPTMVIYGERDPAVVPGDVTKLLAALGTRDRRRVVLPGADHAAQLEDTHTAWVDAVAGFVLAAVGPETTRQR